MKTIKKKTLTCARCDNKVKKSDDFCPNCGALLVDNINCNRHGKQKAEGVCLICCLPYCKSCGGFTNNLFLCDAHSQYEIYEGMARIYGSLNDTPAQHAKSRLEQAGFHPILFSRTQPKGGPRFVYTLFRAAGDFDGHVINEIKVMVPCQEALRAQKILKKFKIQESERATA